eukprot:6509177-Pyramimonas_sp.AAC.1
MIPVTRMLIEGVGVDDAEGDKADADYEDEEEYEEQRAPGVGKSVGRCVQHRSAGRYRISEGGTTGTVHHQWWEHKALRHQPGRQQPERPTYEP